MAADLQLSNDAASAAADAVVDRLDAGAGAGTLKIYSGSVPATADTALGAQVLLATLTFSDPAFGAASDGAATANAITSDPSADATGTASFLRVQDSNGVVVFQGTVGTSDADLVMPSVAIQVNAPVSVTSMVYTHPKT